MAAAWRGERAWRLADWYGVSIVGGVASLCNLQARQALGVVVQWHARNKAIVFRVALSRMPDHLSLVIDGRLLAGPWIHGRLH